MKHAALLIGLFLLLFSSITSAQPIWTAPPQNHAISFEWQKPFYPNMDNVNFLTSSMFLGYKLRTSESLTLLIDVPFAKYDVGSVSQFGLGNPYVGLAIGKESSIITGDVGARAPISDRDKNKASSVGRASDLDRFDAFGADFVPVDANLRLQTTFPGTDFGVRGHFGTGVLIYTVERSRTFDVYMRYGLMGTFKNEIVLAQLGFSGVVDVSSDTGDFSELANHQLVISANGNVGADIWPGLILHIPLDTPWNDIVDMVLGVNIIIGLP